MLGRQSRFYMVRAVIRRAVRDERACALGVNTSLTKATLTHSANSGRLRLREAAPGFGCLRLVFGRPISLSATPASGKGPDLPFEVGHRCKGAHVVVCDLLPDQGQRIGRVLIPSLDPFDGIEVFICHSDRLCGESILPVVPERGGDIALRRDDSKAGTRLKQVAQLRRCPARDKAHTPRIEESPSGGSLVSRQSTGCQVPGSSSSPIVIVMADRIRPRTTRQKRMFIVCV